MGGSAAQRCELCACLISALGALNWRGQMDPIAKHLLSVLHPSVPLEPPVWLPAGRGQAEKVVLAGASPVQTVETCRVSTTKCSKAPAAACCLQGCALCFPCWLSAALRNTPEAKCLPGAGSCNAACSPAPRSVALPRSYPRAAPGQRPPPLLHFSCRVPAEVRQPRGVCSLMTAGEI